MGDLANATNQATARVDQIKARTVTAYDLAVAARLLLDYRNRVGATGFQLEKADDYLRNLDNALQAYEQARS